MTQMQRTVYKQPSFELTQKVEIFFGICIKSEIKYGNSSAYRRPHDANKAIFMLQAFGCSKLALRHRANRRRRRRRRRQRRSPCQRARCRAFRSNTAPAKTRPSRQTSADFFCCTNLRSDEIRDSIEMPRRLSRSLTGGGAWPLKNRGLECRPGAIDLFAHFFLCCKRPEVGCAAIGGISKLSVTSEIKGGESRPTTIALADARLASALPRTAPLARSLARACARAFRILAAPIGSCSPTTISLLPPIMFISSVVNMI